MGEFASKGVAGAGLGTGIAGLALGILNSGAGLLGMGRNVGYGFGNGCGYGYGNACGGGAAFDMSVNEALASRDAEIARLQAKAYSDESDIALYKYIDGELRAIRQELSDQKVFNATANGAVATMAAQLRELQGIVASITRTAVPTSAICDFGNCGCTTVTT